jgi:hypothetical protein
MEIDTYIFSWPKVQHRIGKIVNDLRKMGLTRITIISSGEYPFEHEDVSIHNLDVNAHYGEQFLAAANMFNSDVFLQIQGDIEIKGHLNLKIHLMSIFENQEIGIWTPTINFTSWVDPIVQLEYDFKDHKVSGKAFKNQSIVILNSDCTFWALRSNLIYEYQATPLTISKYGWGIDITLSALSYLNQMLVIKDKRVYVKHPRTTGYAKDAALKEWLEIRHDLSTRIKPVLWLISTLMEARSAKHNRKITVRFNHLIHRIKMTLLRS